MGGLAVFRRFVPVLSKSMLFVATAVAAGLVGAARGLPGAPHPESTRQTVAARPVAGPGARHFASCTDLHVTWPHGVGRASAHDHVSSGKPVTNFHHSTKIYAANTSLDRDGDHIACEAR